MWIASKYGFFSIVEKPPNQFHIRARAEKDLIALLEAAELTGEVTLHRSEDGDYRYRLVVNRLIKDIILRRLSESIDYDNFKNEIGRQSEQTDKLGIYNRIWELLYNYQRVAEETERLKSIGIINKRKKKKFFSSVKKFLDK